jgi:hypothetical protein
LVGDIDFAPSLLVVDGLLGAVSFRGNIGLGLLGFAAAGFVDVPAVDAGFFTAVTAGNGFSFGVAVPGVLDPVFD